jgi:hypothetical protein
VSIPVHFNGSLLNIMGGGVAGPPPAGSISSVTVDMPDEGPGPWIGQLYFGAAGSPGEGNFTNKATFLAANPGLTLQQFTGIAPANSIVVSSGIFTGFTVTSSGGVNVADSGYFAGQPANFAAAPFCALNTGALMTITFSPTVSAVGFNAADQFPGIIATIKFYNGVTLLSTQTINTVDTTDVFNSFSGYGA